MLSPRNFTGIWHIFTLVLFTHLLIDCTAGHAETLDKAVQKLLAIPSLGTDLPRHPLGEVDLAVEAVDRLGSDDEIRAALWKVLNDDSQGKLWRRALEEIFSYQIPSGVLANWVREHLDRLLFEDDSTLSYAMRVLRSNMEETDAQLLESAAGKLPSESDSKKRILLSMAERVPETVKSKLEGQARTRELDGLAAKGDRSTDVLNWIKKKEENQRLVELRRRYKDAFKAGASAADARKAALEASPDKS